MGLRLLTVAAVLAAGCDDVTLLACDDRPRCERAAAVLRAAGVTASVEAQRDHAALTVASGDVAQAVAALRRVDLDDDAPEPTGGLIASGDELRRRRDHDLERSLARTLLRDDAVLDARVHLATPDPLSLSGDPGDDARPTASVLLRVRAGTAGLDDAAVRRIIAGAVPSMRADDVTVERVVARAAPPAPRPTRDPSRAAVAGALALVAAVALWILRRAVRSAPRAQRAGGDVDAQAQQVEGRAGPVADR